MYIELNERLVNKINSLGTDYELKGNMLPSENLQSLLEDLFIELDEAQEQLEDLKQDIEDNYEPKKIDEYEYFGISEADFY